MAGADVVGAMARLQQSVGFAVSRRWVKRDGRLACVRCGRRLPAQARLVTGGWRCTCRRRKSAKAVIDRHGGGGG